MTSPKVVGLYSPHPESGKTAAAMCLQEHGYVLVSFAGPIKRMLGSFLSSAGYEYSAIESALFEHKSNRMSEFGVTPRHLLQTLGTEWGRDCVHPDVWVNVWKKTVNQWLAGGVNVVVDDVRFPNEYDAIKEFSGEMWYVTRERFTAIPEHSSEGALCNHGFDKRLVNDGTLSHFHEVVMNALNSHPVLS